MFHVDILSHKLLELSVNLEGAYSQTELLAASYDVASAGFTEAADAATILEASAKGAVGGMSDLGTVSDAVTSVINAFGLEAKEANKSVDGFKEWQQTSSAKDTMVALRKHILDIVESELKSNSDVSFLLQ